MSKPNRRWDLARPARGRSLVEWVGSVGAGCTAAGITASQFSGPWYVVALVSIGAFLGAVATFRLVRDRGPSVPMTALLALSLVLWSCSILPPPVVRLGGEPPASADRCYDLDDAYLGLTIAATASSGLAGAASTAAMLVDNDDAAMGLDITGIVLSIVGGALTLGSNEVARILVRDCGRLEQ